MSFSATLAFLTFTLTLAHLDPASLGAQEDPPGSTTLPVPHGPYLGQEGPGLTPMPFAVGILPSTLGLAIPPGGEEIVFASWGGEPRARIMVTQLGANGWTPPDTASFSGVYMDWDINVSPDGRRLYFSSQRPRPGEVEPIQDADIWVVERLGEGWGEPRHLGSPLNTTNQEVHPTVSEKGTLFFFGGREGGPGGADIHMAPFVDGSFVPPVTLGSAINTEHNEMDPFIAPDESYLIFHSDRPGGSGRMNLYVSFREEDGSWSPAVRLGDEINKPGAVTYCGRVSQDGRFLFFHTLAGEERILYWVDAKVIERLKGRR
jgi:Tol biopolymer transport system component